ncbi:MAG: hypothetical protein ACOYD4_17885 [Solirubrobacterales bacterium]
MTPGLRRLYTPRPIRVQAGPDGVPIEVDGVAVDAVREEWVVDDRWWTPRPLRRRYFELALADGRALTVFRRRGGQRWYRQRA